MVLIHLNHEGTHACFESSLNHVSNSFRYVYATEGISNQENNILRRQSGNRVVNTVHVFTYMSGLITIAHRVSQKPRPMRKRTPVRLERVCFEFHSSGGHV